MQGMRVSIPGQGAKIPHAAGTTYLVSCNYWAHLLWSPCTTTREPVCQNYWVRALWNTHTTIRELTCHNYWSHALWNPCATTTEPYWAHAPQLERSLHATTREAHVPQLLSPRALEPVYHNYWVSVPQLLSPWSGTCTPLLESPYTTTTEPMRSGVHVPQRERSPCTAAREPCMLQWRSCNEDLTRPNK